jgi:hypothetical protein
VPNPAYHVLIKAGDASAEVEAAARRLGDASGAGLHRHYYVSRANQTVVMATGPEAPITRLLLEASGWKAPREPVT